MPTVLDSILRIGVFVLVFWPVITSAHPSGHLKPIGSHMPPKLDISTMDHFPLPMEFYENYVKPGKPVLFPKILENGEMPAYYKWTDEYLTQHYGSEMINAEIGKKEDRKGNMDTSSLAEFLLKYNDSDIYMVQDVLDSMHGDITIPFSLKCGGFQDAIQMMVLWFSSGSTKSVLHCDNMDNINCLLDGKKDLVLFDKKYASLIESDGYNMEDNFSEVDVESVDMYKFPKLKYIPWYQVNLTKGDCFFIPTGWYHHVYSHTGRNFAVNLWFQKLQWFNVTDCEYVDLNDKSSILLQKFPKPSKTKYYKHKFLQYFDGMKKIKRSRFKYETMGMNIDADKIFNDIDMNGDNKLSWEELYSYNDEIFYKEFKKIESVRGEHVYQSFSDNADEENTNSDTVEYVKTENTADLHVEDDRPKSLEATRGDEKRDEL